MKYNFELKDLHPLHQEQVKLIEDQSLKELDGFIKGMPCRGTEINVIKSPTPFDDSPWSFLVFYKVYMPEPEGNFRMLIGCRVKPMDITKSKSKIKLKASNRGNE